MDDTGVLIFFTPTKKIKIFLLGKADAFHKIVHSINPPSFLLKKYIF